MDEKFFETILRRNFKDETISGVTIKSRLPASEVGSNFLSELRRFVVRYRCRERTSGANDTGPSIEKIMEKECKLMVKREPDRPGPCLRMIKQQNMFEKEIRVFHEILPETERLIGRRLAPRFFRHELPMEDGKFLVLEDLEPRGFIMKNRREGLPRAHVLVVLESIADFHAGSVHQYERASISHSNPESMKSFDEGLIGPSTPKNMLRVVLLTLRMVTETCREWPDPLYRKISDKLRLLEDKFLGEIVKVTDHDETEFCVLNHGDCWTSNIMFREDRHGKPLEVMLIDFQMSVYSSPVIDLVYFLSVCPSIEIKTADEDDFLLGKYLERLTDRMKSIGCKSQPPTLHDLHRAISKRRAWLVLAALAFYPRMIADVADIEDFDELLRSGDTRMDIFKNPVAAIVLRKTLSSMDKKGYLD